MRKRIHILKTSFISIFILFIFQQEGFGQTCNCGTSQTSGDGKVVLLNGSTDPDYNQNAANNFCIPAGTTYTGTIPATNGGTLTICGTWSLSQNNFVTINGTFNIYNLGTIDGNNFNLIIQGTNTTLTNSGTINMGNGIFELSESRIINSGSLTAGTIYLHGRAENTSTGLMTSTATCTGDATTSCGFYVGDKGSTFINNGSFVAVDFLSRVVVTGNGTVDASQSLVLRGDYGSTSTNNIFTGQTIKLIESNNTLSGIYYTDNFLCDNNTFQASVCTINGSLYTNITSTCNGSSTNSSTCAILPVTLKSFSLMEKMEFGILVWESTEESNFSHYEVQVSMDGNAWESISKIQSKGRNSVYQSEKIVRKSLTQYLRLKMVDLDGSMEYSEKIVALRGARSSNQLSVYPNPASKSTGLTIDSPIQTAHLLNIYDISGRKLMTKSFSIGGKHDISIENVLSEGTYIVELLSASESYQTRIIVQRN